MLRVIDPPIIRNLKLNSSIHVQPGVSHGLRSGMKCHRRQEQSAQLGEGHSPFDYWDHHRLTPHQFSIRKGIKVIKWVSVI
jgi:hypothetical protein